MSPGAARVAAALSSIALLGVLPAAAHAAAWTAGPPFAVPTSGGIGGDFVEAQDGSSAVAWFTANDGTPALQVQHAAPDGTLSAPLPLGAGAYPALAASTNNMTAVSWVEVDDGNADGAVHVTFFDPSGREIRDVIVATLGSQDELASDVALDAAGNATVIWTQDDPDAGTPELMAAHVTPDGGHSVPVTLGDTDSSEAPAVFGGSTPAVASGPGGTAWVGWINDQGQIEVASLNSSGGIGVNATQVSADDEDVFGFRVAASAGGAAIAWGVVDDDDPSTTAAHIRGVRLSASGLGSGFGVTGAVDGSDAGVLPVGAGFDLAVGPAGVVSLAWTQANSLLGEAVLTRFAPGQTAGNPETLGDGTALASLAPTLGAAPDGSMLVGWLELSATATATLKAARVAPDGTIGDASTVMSAGSLTSLTSIPVLLPQADSLGGGTFGVVSISAPTIGNNPTWRFSAFMLDTVGPTVTVDVPATGIALSPTLFNGTVSNPSTAPLSWDFGDGSSARGLRVSHVYAGPGTYTVTASASDGAGNETDVTREITVTTAQAGGVTERNAPPPASEPAAAALKVARATRSGARVTVAGTISSRAEGKVTVLYAQRVGRRTVRVKKTARIAKGRWSATLTLPRSLTRGRAARGKGTVTVTFAATAAVKRATVKHAVSIAQAKKAKRAKRRAAAHKHHG
ncbi:MAG TPA: PKD domain-containing protein [Conexibacter sp.]